MFDKLVYCSIAIAFFWIIYLWNKNYSIEKEEIQRLNNEILMNCFWNEFENKIKNYNKEEQIVKEKILENCKEKYITEKSENY